MQSPKQDVCAHCGFTRMRHNGVIALPGELQELMRREKVAKQDRERFFGDATQEELAERIGVTKSRVQQIEKKALRKLRHPSRVPRELAETADVIGGSADA